MAVAVERDESDNLPAQCVPSTRLLCNPVRTAWRESLTLANKGSIGATLLLDPLFMLRGFVIRRKLVLRSMEAER